MRLPRHGGTPEDAADTDTSGTTATLPCSGGFMDKDNIGRENSGISSNSSNSGIISIASGGSSTRASTLDGGEGGLQEGTATESAAASRRGSDALRACFSMGVVSSFAVCAGISGFLLARWEQSAQCDRPLRWWLLIQAILQTFQVVLRLVMLAKIRPTPTGDLTEPCLDSSLSWLAVTPAWKVSKLLSVCNYGWLILGSVWVLDIEDCSAYPTLHRVTALVILQSFMRILLMILYFKWVDPDTVLQNVDTSTLGLPPAYSSRPAMQASDVADTPPQRQERQRTKTD